MKKTHPYLNAISLSLLLAAPACAVDAEGEGYDSELDDVDQVQSALKATGYYCTWTCERPNSAVKEDAGCASFAGSSTFNKASHAEEAIRLDPDACDSSTTASNVSCSAHSACS